MSSSLEVRESMRDILPHQVNGGVSGDFLGSRHLDTAAPTDKYAACVYKLFGKQGLQLSKNFTMGSLDRYEGYPHSTTGLPYALHGTATVINQDIAGKLAGYQDPIKAVMPVGIHKTRKIIIRRKFTVGGQVTAVPERAAARTVGIQEDEREVVLTRYGVDIEMNLNLFHQPELAKQELSMKMDRQQEGLNDTMTELGYEALMQHGTQLPHALMTANPLMGESTEEEKAEYVEHVYRKTIAFAMAKTAFPIPNLLAAAGQSALYMPSTSRQYVMIVPHGMMELEKYTKETTMVHSVSGVPTPDGKPVNLPLDNVQVHTPSGLKILTHIPTPSMRVNGSAYPQAEASGLTGRVIIAMHYVIPGVAKDKVRKFRITDFKARTWKEITVDGTGSGATAAAAKSPFLLVRPRMEIMTSSAILAVPGSETGELLMAYPHTGISTSQTTETLKMQLRVYMGAVVHRPENVIILPDIMPNGIISGHGSVYAGADKEKEMGYKNVQDGSPNIDLFVVAFPDSKMATKYQSKPINMRTGISDAGTLQNNISGVLYNSGIEYPKDLNEVETSATRGNTDDCPTLIYPGRVDEQIDGKWVTIQENAGHLETLDDPYNDRLHGLYRYSPDIPVNHKGSSM